MKKNSLLAAALLMIGVATVYLKLQPAGVDDADALPAPAAVRPPAVPWPDGGPPPSPPSSLTPAATTAATEDFPASVSLDDGPPPLKLYRCAVYARLLGEKKHGAEATVFREAADELDAVIALVRATRPPAVEPAAGDGAAAGHTPDPDAVRAAELARAEQAGPRLAQWLEESYARCDQELAWAHDVWGRVPGNPAPTQAPAPAPAPAH